MTTKRQKPQKQTQKKTVKKTKKYYERNVVITPKVTPDHGINFSTLEPGAFFLMRSGLWQKGANFSQIAQNMSNGNCLNGLCGTFVIPVAVTIQWQRCRL